MDMNPINGAGAHGSPDLEELNEADQDMLRQFFSEAGSSSSAAPEETVYDVSHAAPREFRHRTEARPMPERMADRLSHLGLVPDADQPTMTYDIRGHRYTAALDPSGHVRLIHNPPEAQVLGAGRAGAPDFGAFFIEARDHGAVVPEQWAPLALIEKLRDEGLMPGPNHPTTISLNGKLYNAELAEGGFVRLTRRQV
ncbi:hypothetical protein [Bradyrhizobium elkanii]|uniref:hypothetical protein n=1 Tax=Bradyrhizobium elkanii TaxID=29448 RepID=UPI000841CB15|nr:hypothetical protein [Bradyrhizobium elkanii]ODM75010.1 hypothetical protein A6452_38815 [Bradyrhizobium elkanii]ODM82804.1 hypothetical protein A6X20_16945 [Bradyrhizobium elkanii]